MGKRLALILIFTLLLTPLSLKAESLYAETDNHILAEELQSKDKPIPSALLLDQRFPQMLEIAIQPKDHVLKNAKNKLATKDHPAVKEKMIKRMKNFRNRLRAQALKASKEMGMTLTPQQEDDFIRAYWIKRAEIEKTIYQEMEPRRNELLEKTKQELNGQFPAPAPPVAKKN